MQAKRRILVADDDGGVRDLVRTRLELAGYQVFAARTGKQALDQLYDLRPDAMVLDINMPELDGFSVLEALRRDVAVKMPCTLVLTARHTAEDVQRALGLGAKDYLSKPFSETQLLARVARLLRPPLPKPPSNDFLL